MDKKTRVCYRIMRRSGYARGEVALAKAHAMVARLTGAFAVMDASDWKADPMRVVRNVHSS